MNRALVILLTIFSINAFSQVERFSPYGDQEKDEVLRKSIDFLEILNEGGSIDSESFLTQNETNIQGEFWLQNAEFVKMFGSLTNGKKFDIDNIEAYTFDDVLDGPVRNFVSTKLYRVFSDVNILVKGNYSDKEELSYEYCLVFGLFNESWKITSIYLSDVNLVIKSSQNLDGFRTEHINDMNISIPIPGYFSDRIMENDMISFLLEGETPRDAIIQILSGELKAPIEFMTFKWAEYVAFSRYNALSISVRLHPMGFILEYLIEDENGIENQGISIGLKNNETVVFIQIFSFKETYDKIWQDIDLMIRNIKRINEA